MATPSQNAFEMHFLSELNSQPTAEVLRIIYDRNYNILCAFANKFINDPQIARDIVADSYDRLTQKIDQISARDLERYLYTSIKHKCFEFLRQQKRTATNPSTLSVITPADEAEIEAEISSLIFDELAKLPPQRRQIMLQLFMKGMTSKEVAKRMKLSRQTVLNQKIRALKALRDNIRRRLF